ncbi:MAG: hypothetical protein P8M72_11415 [Gammaproteobacteria bacterium]|nr:hypothetical protein [Gammaproteobacteria bacterium]
MIKKFLFKTSLLILGCLCSLTVFSAENSCPTPTVIQINDHVIGFYFGRELTGPSGYEEMEFAWVNAGAWDLGVINYVVYQDDMAIVFDTSTLPEGGMWEKNYLSTELGIKQFSVVLSHWHLDHIAGLIAYSDSPVYALDRTDSFIRKNRELIETGQLWGPPEIPLVLPTDIFEKTLELQVGEITVKFENFNIHSQDSVAMYIPEDKALYPGGMLEDTITYISEPSDIPIHLTGLKELQSLSIDVIYPNHGNHVKISAAGYSKALISSVIEYDMNMLKFVHESSYLNMTIEDMIPNALSSGVVSIWANYRPVHASNLSVMHEYWQNKSLPDDI